MSTQRGARAHARVGVPTEADLVAFWAARWCRHARIDADPSASAPKRQAAQAGMEIVVDLAKGRGLYWEFDARRRELETQPAERAEAILERGIPLVGVRFHDAGL